MSFGDLLERLKNQVAPDDPQKQAVIAQLMADSAQLAMRGAAGEDVSREIAHVSSQALNLGREERQILAAELNSWLQSTIAGVLSRVFPPA